MKIKTFKYFAPAHWASFLINGDASGLETADIDAASNWLASHHRCEVVDCGAAEFRHTNDAGTLPGDCCEYTLMQVREPRKQKLTFDQALQLISDERAIRAADVLASALKRKVWIARWQLVGCMPDWSTVCTTRADAINSACEQPGDEYRRGMRAALSRGEVWATDNGHGYYLVERATLSDLL